MSSHYRDWLRWPELTGAPIEDLPRKEVSLLVAQRETTKIHCKHSVNPFHPHLTSPSRGRNPFLPSHFGRGRERELRKEPPPNTGSLNTYDSLTHQGSDLGDRCYGITHMGTNHPSPRTLQAGNVFQRNSMAQLHHQAGTDQTAGG